MIMIYRYPFQLIYLQLEHDHLHKILAHKSNCKFIYVAVEFVLSVKQPPI